MGNIAGLLKSSWSGFQRDNALTLAAAISYNTLFAVTPLLLVVLAIVGAVYGGEAARQGLLDRVTDMVGEQGSQMIGSLLQNAARNGTTGSIVGITMTL